MIESIEHKVFDAAKIKKDFPIFNTKINGNPLVYLDTASSAQKPQQVIDAICNYYSHHHSNIHRGVHHLSQLATEGYENARKRVSEFLNAEFQEEIIFTKGCTESINLVASSFTEGFMQAGDEIIISEMEHHANIVPWQRVCEKFGYKLKYIPINSTGELELDEFEKLLSEKTKLVSIVHFSNSLGTINPVKYIIEKAHKAGAKVMIDGAQSAQHLPVDVQDLNCDFFTFSGHKIYGPTGIGVLYGKKALLEQMPPYQTGGDMIRTVNMLKTEYNNIPNRFEAGTPNIAGAIGLKSAIDYVDSIGMKNIESYEKELMEYADAALREIKSVKIIGTAKNKSGVISMNVEGVHHYDLGTLIDQMGVAVRTGQHCTEPVMDKLGITGTLRASFGIYTTKEDIDIFISSMQKAIKMLS